MVHNTNYMSLDILQGNTMFVHKHVGLPHRDMNRLISKLGRNLK